MAVVSTKKASRPTLRIAPLVGSHLPLAIAATTVIQMKTILNR